MKSILIFIAGMATAFFLISVSGSGFSKDYGIKYFEEKGGCITKKPLRVFQVLDGSYALALEKTSSYSNLVVLLMNNDGKYYYDEEVISIPAKKCARQIGVYRYELRDGGGYKTVPVVTIE